MARLTSRMTRVAASPTMEVTAAVDRLRRSGVEVIDLGVGEPDFATPDPIKAAAHEALDRNFTRYTPNSGISELKRAICERYRADYGVQYDESEVIVSAGGKQALFNAAFAILGDGDECITHVPGWPTLVEQIKLTGASPVLVRTYPEDGFALRAAAVLDAVTPCTRAIIINSPANPTGALLSEGELAIIAEEAARSHIWVVLDLCYENLIYDRIPHNLPAVLAARARDLAVLCGSTSKTYAMTGWRCGWALGPADLVAASGALQSHATSNVSSLAQKAAVAALSGPQDFVGAMREAYRARRDALVEWLGEEPRLRFLTPPATFYLFVDVGDLLSPDGLRTSIDFARALLEESRVAVTPGEAFDAPGFIRISYAASMDVLREGSRRLLAFAGAHVPGPARRAAGC
jgi:aspartate aminotransferase